MPIINSLRTQLRFTQLFTFAGFAGVGYTFHRIAEKHHSVFKDLYDKNNGGGFTAPCGSLPPAQKSRMDILPPIRGH